MLIRNKMRRFVFYPVIWVFLASSVRAEPAYFPPHTFTPPSEEFMTQWYTQQLEALEESSLFALSTNAHSAVSYRFLWLRGHHHPVAVRLAVQANGTSTVYVKIANGTAGRNPGNLMYYTAIQLTTVETRTVLDRIRRTNFWNLPTEASNETATDGAEWVVEGVQGGQYHLSEAWSPQKGPIRELGMLFLFYGRLQIPPSEIY